MAAALAPAFGDACNLRGGGRGVSPWWLGPESTAARRSSAEVAVRAGWTAATVWCRVGPNPTARRHCGVHGYAQVQFRVEAVACTTAGAAL